VYLHFDGWSIGEVALLNRLVLNLAHALSINLSIVQDSGIGPTFYIILESDLKPVSNVNIVFKFADDTNLLVPEHMILMFSFVMNTKLSNCGLSAIRCLLMLLRQKKLFFVVQIREPVSICQHFKQLIKLKKPSYLVSYLLTRFILTLM